MFRITPEGMPRIWKTVELTGKQTLHHLHTIILQAFNLKGNHLYIFYMSGKQWDSSSEYGGPSAGAPKKANKTILKSLNLERGKPFIYIYNINEGPWLTIECAEQRTAISKTVYPLLLEEEGELPPREPPLKDSLPEPLKKLLKTLKPTVESWILLNSKPRTSKEVQEARELVISIYKILKEKGHEAWYLLEEATDQLLTDWLLSLPMDFVKKGFTDDAIKLCNSFAPFADEIYFLCEKALVLAQMGQREKSLEQVRDNLTQYPHNPRVIAKAAEAFWKLAEVGHAERLFRKALDITVEDLNAREWILEKLLTMFEENERIDEAIEMVQSELDRG